MYVHLKLCGFLRPLARLSSEVQSLKLADVQKQQDAEDAHQAERLLNMASPVKPRQASTDATADKETKIPLPATRDPSSVERELTRQRDYATYLADCLRERRVAYHKLVLEMQNIQGKKGHDTLLLDLLILTARWQWVLLMLLLVMMTSL